MAITLKLIPKNENADFTAIVTKISNEQDVNLKDFEVSEMTAGFYSYLEEIQEYIIENGATSLYSIESLNESFVPQGATADKIITILHRYLDRIGIDNELIIIDPYFFANTHDTVTYTQTIVDVLEKYLTAISTVIIITNKKVDYALKSSIISKLKDVKSSLIIEHKESQNYHDRFWISNKREKGIVTGTSLNGLGRKYALVDRLNITDVRSIVSSLVSEELL